MPAVGARIRPARPINRRVDRSARETGYEGQLDIYPDRGVTVVILTNQDRALVPAIQQTEKMMTTNL